MGKHSPMRTGHGDKTCECGDPKALHVKKKFNCKVCGCKGYKKREPRSKH